MFSYFHPKSNRKSLLQFLSLEPLSLLLHKIRIYFNIFDENWGEITPKVTLIGKRAEFKPHYLNK